MDRNFRRLTTADVEAGYLSVFNKPKTMAGLRYIAEQPGPYFSWAGFATATGSDMDWVRSKGPAMGIKRHTAHFTGNPDAYLIIDLGDYGAVMSETYATLREFFGIDRAIAA